MKDSYYDSYIFHRFQQYGIGKDKGPKSWESHRYYSFVVSQWGPFLKEHGKKKVDDKVKCNRNKLKTFIESAEKAI